MLVPATGVELVIDNGQGGSFDSAKKIPAKLTGDQMTAELTIEASSSYRVAVVMPTESPSTKTSTSAPGSA